MDFKPAFPGKYTVPEFSFNTALGMQVEPAHDAYNPGMTMRQYYKAMAPAQEIEDMVPSDVARCAAYIGVPESEYIGETHYKLALAKARGEWADAMIKEDEEHGKL